MKSDQKIRFSVIVPVFNTEKFLSECIDSVLNQGFKNYELILINDGSVDSSGKICDKYASRYSQIRAYHKDNNGQLHTRQYGIEKATGEYCIFLDSDDYLTDNALECLDAVICDKQCDCVIFGMLRVKNGNVLSYIQEKENCVIRGKREIYRKILMDNQYNSMCRKAIKTSLLKGAEYPQQYYRFRYGEDLLQSLDVLKKCNEIVFIKDALYNYRINESSVTQNIHRESFITGNSVRMEVLRLLREENVFLENDFNDYRYYCIDLFMRKVCNVIAMNIEKKEKIQLLKKLKEEEYYRNFISIGSANISRQGRVGYLYYLYKNECYDMLIFLVGLRKRMR